MGLLVNDTNVLGYAGLKQSKGSIVVVDGGLREMRHMVIRKSYILAHTNQVRLV